jgi:hypothetical protein
MIKFRTVLFLIAFCFLKVNGQTIEKFALAAQSAQGTAFFVNSEEIRLTDFGIEFYVAFADADGYLIHTIEANCFKRIYRITKAKGVLKGTPVEYEFDKPKAKKAKDNPPFDTALKLVCGIEA